jgi:hypothetical protein
MTKKSIHFWILSIASLLLASLIISFAFKIVKAILFLLALLVLTPLIYGLLKSLLASQMLSRRSDKMKRRE